MLGALGVRGLGPGALGVRGLGLGGSGLVTQSQGATLVADSCGRTQTPC